MADFTYTNYAKRDQCQQFRPERRQARKAENGRLLRKLCHPGNLLWFLSRYYDARVKYQCAIIMIEDRPIFSEYPSLPPPNALGG